MNILFLYLIGSAISSSDSTAADLKDPIVVCGYSDVGETVVNYLTSPLLSDESRLNHIIFDLDPTVVMEGYKQGRNILYGDGTMPLVLSTAGVKSPRAFVITYEDKESTLKGVERLRQAYPTVPIMAR